MAGEQLAIGYSATALAQVSELKARAATNPTGEHATVYNAVARVLRDFLTRPGIFNDRSCWLRDNLANVGRVKVGRYRLFFLASSRHQRCVLLFIGYRKEGDKRDAYEEFARLLKRGTFDDIFEALQVAKPR